jgi:EpsI family protein
MSSKRTIIVSALMILTLVCLSYLSHGENIRLNKPFSTFPKQIGNWVGEERRFDKKVYDMLGVDDSILCNYINYDGHQIELYIGFYKSQREGDLIHSPKNCMPGAGWHFAREEKLSIDAVTSEKKSIFVNNMLMEKENERQVMFYWFQGRNRYMTSEYMQKIYLVVDSITKHRTDEAFIRLTTPLIDGDDEKTVKYLEGFTQLLIPLLQEYLPS